MPALIWYSPYSLHSHLVWTWGEALLSCSLLIFHSEPLSFTYPLDCFNSLDWLCYWLSILHNCLPLLTDSLAISHICFPHDCCLANTCKLLSPNCLFSWLSTVHYESLAALLLICFISLLTARSHSNLKYYDHYSNICYGMTALYLSQVA